MKDENSFKSILFVCLIFIVSVVGGCPGGTTGRKESGRMVDQMETPGERKVFDRLSPDEFNAAAVRANLGLFWKEETGKELRPDDLAPLLFYPPVPEWTKDGEFTPWFERMYESLVEDVRRGPIFPPGLAEEEKERRKLVRRELDQGRPTLVYNDLRDLSSRDKKFVLLMQETAQLIDELFAKQKGLNEPASRIPSDDNPSASMFRRNWGPRCYGPETQNDPNCSAVDGGWKEVVDVYPQDLQSEKGFCNKIEKHKQGARLKNPFVVVRRENGSLTGVPYNDVYRAEMEKIAENLEKAAALFEGSDEKTLHAYLEAAAGSFRSNNWEEADEAWAAMNAANSSWYLRVAPDEVYWDPCNFKAGFHLTLARINKDSLEWQEKLSAVRQEMENALAALIGRPYKARKVTFQMPDFIDIVLNSGDDRKPFGAIIGQSLPNWGPVANEGRGRTVTMTNLYTDPESLAIRRSRALSVLSSASDYPETTGVDLLGIMLHEAAHNLGPSHEYRVKGKKDTEVFGGPLATFMEELKAQTAALYYVDFLLKREIIDQKRANESYVDSFLWALGQISRGMDYATGTPNPYGRLSAVQIGFFLQEGAISFDLDTKAANGKDAGAFTLHLEKFPEAAEKLMRIAGRIKARGDRAGAEELVKKYVESDAVPHDFIKERWLRHPNSTFVYAYDL